MKWCIIFVFCSFGGILSSQESNPFDIPNARISIDTTEVLSVDTPVVLSSNVASPDSSILPESLGSTPVDQRVSSDEVNPFDITGVSPVATAPREETIRDSGFKSPIDLINSSKDGFQDTRLIVLVFVLVMLIILSLAVGMDRKKFSAIFKSTINSNNLKTLYRETNAWTNGQIVILYTSFFLIGSFLMWLLSLKHFGGAAVHLWWIALALVACYMIRHFTIWLLGSVYPLGAVVGQFNYSIMLHNIVLALFLLPVVLAVEFVTGVEVKIYICIALGLFLLAYAFRQVKGIISLVSMRGFNPLYFFIYLCAVEIAPIMVFYKIIVGAL